MQSTQLTTVQSLQRHGIVGSSFRDSVAKDIEKAVIMRGAQDVVRLTGPTGSGKDMVIQAVHELAGERLGRKGDLIEFDCRNLPDYLFDSTLFGHTKGAFQGASRAAKGLVDKAAGGTLVLNGVDKLPLDLQGRLLNLLGSRSYNALGSDQQKDTDALIMLVSSHDPQRMLSDGETTRELLDRAPAKIELKPLFERRQDIRELVSHFGVEAAREMRLAGFEGFTLRASEDIEKAVVNAKECSVRRLRELVRDIVFDAAAAGLISGGDPITGETVMGYLKAEFGYDVNAREAHDVVELEESFDTLVQQEMLAQLAQDHQISEESLMKLCEVLHEIVMTPDGRPKCYRNIVERSNLLLKVAFWLVSKANTQSEFRRFFGTKSFEMPAKSVAWQIYNEVFGRDR